MNGGFRATILVSHCFVSNLVMFARCYNLLHATTFNPQFATMFHGYIFINNENPESSRAEGADRQPPAMRF